MSKTPRCLALLALAAALPAQAAIVHSAFDTPAYEDSRSMGGPNLLLAIQLTMPVSAVVTRAEIFTGERSGLNTLAIWTHDPNTNAPGTQLGIGSWEMTSNNSWQGAPIANPVPLSTGQTFWLVWGPQNAAQASSEGTGAGAQPYRGSFNGGASWNGPFMSVQWKFRLWAGPAGHYEIFGSGCSGSSGVPRLAWDDLPTAGSSFDLLLDNGPLSGSALLGFGLSNTSYLGNPLPYSLSGLGGGACEILAAPESTVFVLTDPSGSASYPTAFPANPALAGVTFYNQFFCLDAAANTLGLTTSNGGIGIVGS
ncbi:MAG: hypothetical protein KDE27_29180 [Planctomycetes bacterium]|nr:hypothetical protein [Planctomycetota bacterium]